LALLNGACAGENQMAERKSFFGPPPNHPELDRLREETRHIKVTDAQLAEQRVSFIYGNAPQGSGITRDSAQAASSSIRITKD
jgi:hypothetical protein